MQISLHNIIPIPLKDKLTQRSSDIWNKEVNLNQKVFIKIKAPSGTGKTTFIHSIYGIRNDYTGVIKYDGISIVNLDVEKTAEIRQKKISVIFQDLRLFENLTALENIELKRNMNKPTVTELERDEMIEALGVKHILHQKAKICSYGEQQRISIIRALMQPFEWLLMDEPFSHLDINNTKKAAALILKQCIKNNAGFVLTDLDEDSHFQYQQFYNL